jgi:diguanylate cyclase (GGDEF)-like protein
MALDVKTSVYQMTYGVALLDENLNVELANSTITEMLKVGGDDGPSIFLQKLRNASPIDATSSDTASDRYTIWRQKLLAGLEFEDRLKLEDGRTMTASYRPLPDKGWIILVDDSDARVDARAILALQHQRVNAALGNMPHGLCLFDAKTNLILCNPAYARLYDLPPSLTVSGTPLSAILEYRRSVGNGPEDESTYFDGRAEADLRSAVANTEVKLADGRTIRINHNPLPEGGYVATHEDITRAVQAAEQITFMARHDPLTGLCNRTLLRDKLEHEMTFSRSKRPIAIACIDLDHFKDVNDTLGHPVGDQLLKVVTDRIQACVRSDDTVARFGGDEFVVLMADTPSQAEAGAVAARIIDAVAQPYDLGGNRVEISASIGLALSPGSAATADALIGHADLALYRAKADGRGVFRFFETEMDAKKQERRRLEMELRQAIRLEQFEVFYQPEIDVPTKAILGFEALLRWHHPERGLVSPNDFLPLAEETGLIVPIGEWVLRRACRDAASWPSNLKIAVNVSGAQFKSRGLAHTVISALAESGVNPGRLELEITESVLLADTEFALATLHHIKSLGVQSAMDDFGTGYSSLSYLRLFPFDKIKIDQSFVNELSMGGDAAAIVRAVIALGASLGITTIAEGVETEEQLKALVAEGCDAAQGYLVGRPTPASELKRFFPRSNIIRLPNTRRRIA